MHKLECFLGMPAESQRAKLNIPLRNKQTFTERNLHKFFCDLYLNFGYQTAPFGMWELHGGQVVHDSDVDEALGVLHDTEDGLKVWGPASCTEGWRGTLTERRRAAPVRGLLIFSNIVNNTKRGKNKQMVANICGIACHHEPHDITEYV